MDVTLFYLLTSLLLHGCQTAENENLVIKTIEFPTSPGEYPGNYSQAWTLEFDSLMNFTVNVTYLDTEESNGCKADALRVFNPAQAANGPVLCGNLNLSTVKAIFSIQSYSLVIRFTSDQSIEGRGFSARVTGRRVQGDEICAMMDNRAGFHISSAIAGYGERYPPLLNCSWLLHIPEGYSITLEFSYFDIEFSGPDCLYDKLEILCVISDLSQKGLLGRFCGRRTQWIIRTRCSDVMVRFITDKVDNNKGFTLKHGLAKLNMSDKDGVVRELAATLQPRLFPEPTAIIGNDSPVGWRLQTHPGYTITVTVNDGEILDHFGFHDGPFATSKVLTHSSTSVYSNGFFMYIGMMEIPLTGSSPVNFTYVATVGIDLYHYFDQELTVGFNYPLISYLTIFKFVMSSGEHPKVSLHKISKRLASLQNTDDCLYSGIALYDGTVSFGHHIGPFCDVIPGYTTDLFANLIGSSSVLYAVIYDYVSKQMKAEVWNRNDLVPLSSRCRGYQVTERMFKTGKLISDHSLLLKVRESNDSRNIQVVYYQDSIDCIVIQLLPFQSDSQTLDISLSGNFVLRICRQWGFSVSAGTKYDGVENCTTHEVSEGITKTLIEPLCLRSGWTKEFIRLEIGPVSTADCPLVSCSAGGNNTMIVSCGYIYGTIPEDCATTLLSPRDRNPAEYVWEFWITTMRARSEFSEPALIISQLFGDLKHLDTTRITNDKIDYYKRRDLFLKFKLILAGVNIRVSGENVADIAVTFKHIKRYFNPIHSSKTYSTKDGKSCIKYRNNCYALVRHSIPTAWTMAQQNCEQEGGKLLSINTVEELSFVKTELDNTWRDTFYGNNSGIVFIGLTDISKVGDHRWEDGSPLTFSDWYYPFAMFQNIYANASGTFLDFGKIQPVKDTSQRCVAMIPNGLYSTNWRKLQCNETWNPPSVYSICEVEMIRAGRQSTVHLAHEELGKGFNRLQCKSDWTFVQGHCFRVSSKTSQGFRYGEGYISPLFGEELCREYHGASLAQIDDILGETLLNFLLSVGFRPGADGIWVMLSDSHGCVSLPEIRDSNEYQARLLIENSSCAQNAGFTKHAICESSAVPVQRLCGFQQFTCDDGTCIHPDRVCDTFPDCNVGEDENGCSDRNYTYHCDDGAEISILKYCDFLLDCTDGSDETKCSYANCTESEYKCKSGQCIPYGYRCDLQPDCFDESDEAECDTNNHCPGFICPIYGCLPWIKTDDIEPDCPDGTAGDEVEVGMDLHEYSLFFFSVANSDRHLRQLQMATGIPWFDGQRCHEDHGGIYPRGMSCVYDHDVYGDLRYCRNGAHLQHCKEHECPDMFKCPRSYCVPPHKVCDGVKDCIRGEDELRCENRTCPFQLRCGRTSQCVSQPYVCDGQVHCKQGYDDERFCDLKSLKCPLNCTCFGYNVNCTSRQLIAVPYITSHIRILDLSRNYLELNDTALDNLEYLTYLYIRQNAIHTVCPGTFRSNRNLLLLDLSNNIITSIQKGTFLGLHNLLTLILQGNPITEISQESFIGLSSLPSLDLSNMLLTKLPSRSFIGLDRLAAIDLSNNSIRYIHSRAIVPATRLTFLNLANNNLNETATNTFRTFQVENLRTDFYFVCCYVGKTVTDCYPPLDSFRSCSDLFGSKPLQAIVWTFAVLALIGNGGVILWRLKAKLTTAPSIFVFNLSIADLLMGVYLLSLAIADLKYKGHYALNDHSWRHSKLCLVIGAIATISCQMSTFTLVCIAVDRTKRIAFPFSSLQLGRGAAIVIIVSGWVACTLTALAPFAWPSYFGDYYSRNSVCVPFNFSDPLGKGWEFSFFLFVVLNMIGVFLVVSMYVLVYIKVRNTGAKAGRGDRQDLDVARKLSVVIMTDVICVIPLTITNLMGTLGEPIDRDMASVLTAVILPINSALNPYLFTFRAVRSH